jgi:hypothetical protein
MVSFTLRPLYSQGIGGWVDPGVDLGDMEKLNFLTLPGLELQRLGGPASSQSLYRLTSGSPAYNVPLVNVVTCG